MKTLFTVLITSASLSLFAQGVSHHRAYTKKDGTYVPAATQTKPNKTTSDNYSEKGNTNPYTGKQGTVTPTNTSGKNVQTGPRGGQYYINSNGKKTYVKH